MSNDRKLIKRGMEELAQNRMIMGNIESRLQDIDISIENWYKIALAVMVVNVISLIINLHILQILL